MADHVIVANDTEPPFEDWLDFDDVPYDDPDLPPIPVDATVTFIMATTDGTPIQAEATVVDAATRLCRQTFTKEQTAIVGDYDVQWQIDYADGRRQTHPSDVKVKIVRDLGGPT